MPPILDRKLRFSDVVFAIDTTAKALRNWLQRGQVTLTADGESGWRDFSVVDVALLAIVRRLVTFGVPIDDADGIAAAVVMRHAKMLSVYKAAPVEAFLACFLTRHLVVINNKGWQYIEINGSRPIDFGNLDACIYLDLHRVIDRAVKRAIIGTEVDEGPFDDEAFLASVQKLTITLQDATPNNSGADLEQETEAEARLVTGQTSGGGER